MALVVGLIAVPVSATAVLMLVVEFVKDAPVAGAKKRKKRRRRR